jgi:nucleotide-binding universal stress UspA family protein
LVRTRRKAMTQIQTIVVGTDGSETATRAVARATELASQTGAVLHIVTAYKPTSVRKLQAQRASLPEEFGWSLSADSEAQNVLRHAAEHAARIGVKVETHLATGNAAKVIIKTARDLGADIVVVGNKGIQRRIRRSVPGGVSQDADRDVLVVDTTSARSVRRYDFGHSRHDRRPQTATSPARSSG